MQIDTRSEFDSAKHLVAGTTYLTSFYNCGGDFDLGPGTPLWWVLSLDTIAEAGATPTYVFTLETDDNSSFTTPETIGTFNVVQGTPAGRRFVLGFPFSNQKYLRVKAVLADAGATADVTVSSWMTNEQPPSYQAYPQNLNN